MARPALILSPFGRFLCVEPPHPTHHATKYFSRATVTREGVVHVSGTGAGHMGDAAKTPRRGAAGEEARWALENVAHVLEYCDSDFRQVFKVTMLVSEKTFYNECNEAYLTFLRTVAPGCPLPMRTCSLWGVPTDMKVGFACEAYLRNGAASVEALWERAEAGASKL